MILWPDRSGEQNLDVQFIFIAGVEGCGHHGLFPVIETAIKSSIQAEGSESKVFPRWPPIRELFNALWSSRSVTPQQQQYIRMRIGELMQHGVKLAHSTGCRQFVLEDNSFPSGMNRDLAWQWDIVEMVELLKPYADIKVLALYRDPVAMTFSHEEWDGGPENHARLVAAFLEHLNNKLLQLDPAVVKTVYYEDLVDNQDQLAEPLSSYLELELESIKTGFQQVRKSEKNWQTQMPPERREWMTTFFSNERLALWPVFTDPGYNLAASPRSVRTRKQL